MKTAVLLSALIAVLAAAPVHAAAPATNPRKGPWLVAQAQQWQQREGWRVGCNFLPSTAINQHEMWSAANFDAPTITRELALARKTGFNTLRVYLHDLTFGEDPEGFLSRMETFLKICAGNDIKPVFVFFDACWLSPAQVPALIPQPRPGTHNSGWLQSPGWEIVQLYPRDRGTQQRLRFYLQTVMRRFANDPRVLCWDIFNEPGNQANRRFDENGAEIPGESKAPTTVEGDAALLRDAYQWSWEINPVQPVTSGVWSWKKADQSPIAKLQLQNSDIISFHCYGNIGAMKGDVQTIRAQANGRPILCTEYMSRPTGSTFQNILPYLAAENIGAINWGFVDGKSQTRYSWNSWKKPEGPEAPWFHDIYQKDGTPYDPAEVTLIQRLSKEKKTLK